MLHRLFLMQIGESPHLALFFCGLEHARFNCIDVPFRQDGARIGGHIRAGYRKRSGEATYFDRWMPLADRSFADRGQAEGLNDAQAMASMCQKILQRHAFLHLSIETAN